MAHYINDNCIGCNLCTRNCPVSAISGGLKEKHVIDENVCIDCGACSRVCNKGAITPGPEARKVPVLDADKCTGCQLCIINCVKKVLKISEPEFKGDISTHSYLSDANKCVGCGYCAIVCPMNGITMVEEEVYS